MPDFHIDVRQGATLRESFPYAATSRDVVRVEVGRFVGELMRDHADQIWSDRDWEISVSEVGRGPLYRMRIGAETLTQATPGQAGPRSKLCFDTTAPVSASRLPRSPL